MGEAQKQLASSPNQLRHAGLDYVEGEDVRPAGLDKATAEEYAEAVAEQAKHRPGDDVRRVVEKFGGRIVYHDIVDWPSEDGSIFVHDPNDFDVLLARYTGPVRDQFTIAHELGHYFLHARQGEVRIIAHRRGSGRREWEANWFAAALLMPSESFRKSCANGLNVNELAATFNVSRSAVAVRRKALDC